ncbi:MAG: heptaprenyl diphosphate synthase, partial [Treponema sp.]|nr:heptaprenyl diphosphate synthase [Treponema sp.]
MNNANQLLLSERLDAFRLKRRGIYNELFGPGSLCIAGLLIMPAMLFIPSEIFRTVQFLGFWFLCWLAGKKNNPLLTLSVAAVIIIFNLIIPYGRVLLTIGFFSITEGALMTGIQRAATLEGLIMLSRLTIRADLRIPGSFGEMTGESFRLFTILTESKPHITLKNMMNDIDALMLDLEKKEVPVSNEKKRTRPAG